MTRKDISNKLIIFGSDRKKTTEFCHLAEKGHVWEGSGVVTHRKRELEIGTLLTGNDKNNVIADEI